VPVDFRLGNHAAQVAATALLLLCSCSSTDDSATSSLVGRWRYYFGSVLCQVPRVSHPLSEIDVEIVPLSKNRVEFRAGPRCHLTLDDSPQRASLKTEQRCEMSLHSTTAFATVSAFTFEAVSDDEALSTAEGSVNLLVKDDMLFCEHFVFEEARLVSRGPIPR